jgi:hypothetical protein
MSGEQTVDSSISALLGWMSASVSHEPNKPARASSDTIEQSEILAWARERGLLYDDPTPSQTSTPISTQTPTSTPAATPIFGAEPHPLGMPEGVLDLSAVEREVKPPARAPDDRRPSVNAKYASRLVRYRIVADYLLMRFRTHPDRDRPEDKPAHLSPESVETLVDPDDFPKSMLSQFDGSTFAEMNELSRTMGDTLATMRRDRIYWMHWDCKAVKYQAPVKTQSSDLENLGIADMSTSGWLGPVDTFFIHDELQNNLTMYVRMRKLSDVEVKDLMGLMRSEHAIPGAAGLELDTKTNSGTLYQRDTKTLVEFVRVSEGFGVHAVVLFH